MIYDSSKLIKELLDDLYQAGIEPALVANPLLGAGAARGAVGKLVISLTEQAGAAS